MSKNSVVHQALLKPQFAHLYPGVVSNEWQPAGAMLDQVNATLQRRGLPPRGAQGALNPEHFALRGTLSAGAKQVARELRTSGRKRQRPS